LKITKLKGGVRMESYVYVALAWFVYNIWGLIASFSSKESFDPKKFGKTIIWAVLVSLFAVTAKVAPAEVITGYGSALDVIITTVMNTGPGISLIWFIDRAYKTITGLGSRIEELAKKGSS